MYIYRESYLHWWVFVIRCSTRCKFNGCYSNTPDVCFKFIATNLVIQKKKLFAGTIENIREKRTGHLKLFPTCSMTSGAIQHGVPTNVFLSLFLVMSLPVAKKALTPKSIMCGGGGKKA